MSTTAGSVAAIRARLLTGRALIRAYVALLGAAGAAVWVAVLAIWPAVTTTSDAPVLVWVSLAALAYATEAWVVHVHYRRQAHTLSLNEIVIVLGLFFMGPLGLLLAQLTGPSLALALNRGQRSVKLAFNVAQLVLTTGLAVVVFEVTLGPASLWSYQAWAAALLAITVHGVAGVVLVSVVIWIAEGEWSLHETVRTALFSIVGTIAGGSVALAAVELIRGRPASLAFLLVPSALCGLALRSYMRQRQESERVEFLYESMRRTQEAADTGTAARELLLAARHLLRAEYAEILLVSLDESAGSRSVSNADGDTLMGLAPLTEVERDTLSVVHRAKHAVLAPRQRPPHVLDPFLHGRGISDALVSALRGEERLLGLIVVGERSSDVASFEGDDVALLDTFAGHASVVLENNRLEQSLAQVTELKERLHHQVLHDHLTGLPNRVQFADAVGSALERCNGAAGAVGVLFLDLDGFKRVNDTLGHAAGDELLVMVGERLRESIRGGDVAARLGGDEFAVLLDGVTSEEARDAAARILQALDRPHRIAGQEVVCHASMGIALATGSADADELIRNADVAMYTAKADETRPYVFYEPSFHLRLRRRRELALQLERAVDRGEIEVHLQPVIALADGSVHAFEALARWRHPDRGLLPAAEFIPVAEESGLIVDIGRAVISSACGHASAWTDVALENHGIGLWLNVSPAEFANQRLVDDLAIAITSARLDPHQVTIEVTESSVVRDLQQSTTTLRRLRALGVGVAIDDFGTGYSSLSRLGELPIDILKIPKPFVDRLAGTSPDVTIVDAILRLASSLGLTAVAEGVEGDDQIERLRGLGCALAQGYLFGRPVDPDETLRMLRGTGRRAVPAVPPL